MQTQTIPFFMHDLGREEIEEITKVLKGPILTTGETVKNFEEAFSEYLDCKYAIGLTSCTGAMHLSLLSLDIGQGDEVITTPMTFIATSTAIIEAGAKPVFVDIEESTGNLDATLIEKSITKKTKAILPVHLYGQMCDMQLIHKIAEEHKLKIIEDAAHCIEGSRNGIRPGHLSDIACFSFYATKNLTCGEGGAAITNNATLNKDLILLRSHGMDKTASDRAKEGYKHWDMVKMGWKYNMDNIQAAMLIPQLKRLTLKSKNRKELAEYYSSKLSTVKNVQLLETLPGVEHALHLFPILIKNLDRDTVIMALQARGISVMVNYRPVHLTKFFRETFGYKDDDFPKSENFGKRILSLPFYPGMPTSHIDRVVNALGDILGNS